MSEQEGKEPECRLPTSVDELDIFVDLLIKDYALPPGDDTYDVVATMILHLPQTKAFMPRSYFGNGVYKSLANQAAFTRLGEIRQRRDAQEQEAQAAAKLSLVQQEETTKDAMPVGEPSIQNA